MIVNPGIRRFLGSAIQRLFNSASFYAPLTHSLVLERGTGSPSFTRATTATGQKWDEAGYLDFTALAGEIVFKGARREYNLVTKSEDLTVGWTPNGTGSVTATTMVFTGAGGEGWNVTGFTGTVGHVYQWQALMSVASGTHTMRFRVSGPALGEVTVTTTPTVFSFTTTSVSASTIFGIYNGATPSAGTVNVTQMQLSDITGETDQTTIRPYVSVGAPSDWAGAELVTNGTFDTDTTWIKESGWTIGGGAAIAATASATLYQTDTLAIGTKYVASFSVSSVSAGSVSIRIGGAPLVPYDFKTAAGTYSVEFVADAVSTLVGVIGIGFTGTVDNISVKPAIYHGSMVDGVKCYDTDRSGNPISTSGSYPLVGYVPWEARTNLLLQSAVVATQSITVAAVAHTLSFKGTGTITLSGVSVAGPLVGTGANDRVTLTFTPTAGSLTLTVSGSCTVGQLEAGSFATPYIPTTTVAVARNADVESVTTSGAILAAGGTISLTYIPYHSPVGTIALWGTYVDASNYTAILHDATNLIFRKRIAGVNYDATIANTFTSGTTYKMAASWGAGGSTIYLNGVAGTPHANTTAAQIAATMQFGADGNSLKQPGAAVIKNYIWQRQLSGSEQAAVTS